MQWNVCCGHSLKLNSIQIIQQVFCGHFNGSNLGSVAVAGPARADLASPGISSDIFMDLYDFVLCYVVQKRHGASTVLLRWSL